MPGLLLPKDYDAWLDTAAPHAQSLAPLKLCPEDWLRAYRVSRAVNSVKTTGRSASLRFERALGDRTVGDVQAGAERGASKL